MGADIPLAVLSRRVRSSLFRYFKQHFAQVTNPPIDPIREEIVMSMVSCVGGEGNLLDETPRQCRHAAAAAPDPHRRRPRDAAPERPSATSARPRSRCAFRRRRAIAERGPARGARDQLHEAPSAPSTTARSVLILSDRDVGPAQAPIPSLLATGAVHHPLIRAGRRMRCGLVVESAEPREVAHLALLVGYGAGAVNPYLALDTVAELARRAPLGAGRARRPAQNVVKALQARASLKIDGQDGHLTLVAATRARRSSRPWASTRSSIDALLHRAPRRASAASGSTRSPRRRSRATRAGLRPDGARAPARAAGTSTTACRGEPHLWTPDTVACLQRAVRLDDAKSYDEYARLVNDQGAAPGDAARPLGSAPARSRRAPRRGRAGEGARAAASRRARCRSAASPRRRTRTSPSR